jgi:hypothetical protein
VPSAILLRTDNNLEVALRQDIIQLLESPGISDKSLTTWIYLDQRGIDPATFEQGGDPIMSELPLVLYNSDGTQITGNKFQGSRYMTYDHGMSKMIVDTVITGEQNSDDPQTVYDFMFRALPDCVAKGAKEYFMIFSSHGTGFRGFGGDESHPEVVAVEQKGNPDMADGLGHRRLIQPNQNIVDAIKLALADVPGAPPRLNVIGFDACLMSALEAVSCTQLTGVPHVISF